MTTPFVLCVGAGMLQVPLLQEAKALGLQVIATDGNPEAPGATVADAFYPIDTYDVPGHIHLVKHLRRRLSGVHVVGVVTAGADVAPTVAAAAQAAGVPGIPVTVAARSHDKAAVRDTMAMAGLSCYQPGWIVWIPGDVPWPITHAIADEIGYPCVLKPLQQRASRGVSIVHDREALPCAVEKVRAYGERFLVEAYHTGTEHSVEAILSNEQLLWFNVVDRYFTYTDGIPLETGHVNPSRLSQLQQQRLELMLRLVAKALDVRWGPFKMDVLWTENGPILLEATCRLSGGWDCQRTSPLTGRNPLRTLLQVACQLPVDPMLAPQGYAACAAILPQETGILQQLPEDEWHMVPGGEANTLGDRILWTVHPGDLIHPPAHCAERVGFVMTWASTYEAAWASAQEHAAFLAPKMEIV